MLDRAFEINGTGPDEKLHQQGLGHFYLPVALPQFAIHQISGNLWLARLRTLLPLAAARVLLPALMSNGGSRGWPVFYSVASLKSSNMPFCTIWPMRPAPGSARVLPPLSSEVSRGHKSLDPSHALLLLRTAWAGPPPMSGLQCPRSWPRRELQ